jgi:RIO-like serine/threonine protein kinase
VTAAIDKTLPAQIGEFNIQVKLGEGGRSIVYGGEWRGRQAALKVYKSAGISKHRKRHPTNIAEFEYQRNKAIYEVAGLSAYIAQPFYYWATPDVCALVQERLKGPLYYFYYRDHQGKIPPAFKQHLETILDRAHEAGIYDVDMHAFNVIVDESGDEPVPKLFDFNLIPFHERSGISISKFLFKLGLTNKASRDRRMLRGFDKVARREKKLIKYFE